MLAVWKIKSGVSLGGLETSIYNVRILVSFPDETSTDIIQVNRLELRIVPRLLVGRKSLSMKASLIRAYSQNARLSG